MVNFALFNLKYKSQKFRVMKINQLKTCLLLWLFSTPRNFFPFANFIDGNSKKYRKSWKKSNLTVKLLFLVQKKTFSIAQRNEFQLWDFSKLSFFKLSSWNEFSLNFVAFLQSFKTLLISFSINSSTRWYLQVK